MSLVNDESTARYEQSGRLNPRKMLIGGILGGLGALVAWLVIGNLIR